MTRCGPGWPRTITLVYDARRAAAILTICPKNERVEGFRGRKKTWPMLMASPVCRVESVDVLNSQANSSILPNYLALVFYNGSEREDTFYEAENK
jgi:hypothetical protein